MRRRVSRGWVALVAVAALVGALWLAWAYVNRPPRRPGRLVQQRQPGGRAVQILEGSYVSPMAWSPDGKLVAVHWLAAGRSEVLQAARLPGIPGQPPAVFRLGRLVAGELLVTRTSDGALVRRFEAPVNTAYWPGLHCSWTPAGDAVLVAPLRGRGAGDSIVFRCEVGNGRCTALLAAGSLWGAVASPDRSGFALYDTARNQLDLYDKGGAYRDVVFRGFVWGLAWLPSGELLVGGVECSGSRREEGLFLVSPPSAPARRLLARDHVLPHGLCHSLNGLVPINELVLHGSGAHTRRLGVVDVQRNEARGADCGAAVLLEAALALEGGLVITQRSRPGPSASSPFRDDLWALRMTDGGWLRITDWGDIGWYAVSPDGTRVAFDRHRRPGGLWVLQLNKKAIMSAKPARYLKIVTEPFLPKAP